MDEETLVGLVVISVSGLACLITIGLMCLLEKCFPNWWPWVKVALSGLFPTVFIIAALFVWHEIAVAEHSRNPSEGFMSPLLVLLYGFPYVLINLAANIAAANWARHRK